MISVSVIFKISTSDVVAVRIEDEIVVVIPAYVDCCLPFRFSFSITTLPPADAYPKGSALIVPEAVGLTVPTPTLISKVLSALVSVSYTHLTLPTNSRV